MYCFSQFCYCCLKKRKDLVDINEKDTDNVTFKDKFSYCLMDLQTDKIDEIPKLICQKCCKGIHFIYLFKQIYLARQKILSGYVLYLKNVNTDFPNNYCNLTINVYNIDELLNQRETINIRNDINFIKCEIEDEANASSEELFDIKVEPVDFTLNSTTVNDDAVTDLQKEDKCVQNEIIENSVYIPNNVSSVKENYEIVQNVEGNQNGGLFTSNGLKLTIRKSNIENKENSCGTFKNKNNSKPKNHQNVSCIYCNQRFSNVFLLRIHDRKHPAKFKYTCKICNKEMSHKHTFKMHVSNHSGEFKFKCNVCRKGLNTKRALMKHKLSHKIKRPKRKVNKIKTKSNEVKLKMDIFDETNIKNANLLKTIYFTKDLNSKETKIKSNTKKINECLNLKKIDDVPNSEDIIDEKKQICKSIKKLQTLSNRIKLNENSPEFVEENNKISKMLRRLNYLENHEIKVPVTPDNNEPEAQTRTKKLDICKILTNTVEKAQTTQINEAEAVITPEKVDVKVSEAQITPENLDEKFRKVLYTLKIPDEASISQTNTNKKKRKKGKLINKQKANENEGKLKKYECAKCTKTFMYKSWLAIHQTNKNCNEHTFEITENLFRCDVCNEIFEFNIELKQHLKQHSFGGKFKNKNIYKCEKCSKTFKYKSVFSIHINRKLCRDAYYKKRNIKCGICKENFKFNVELQQHFEKTHVAPGVQQSLTDIQNGGVTPIKINLRNNKIMSDDSATKNHGLVSMETSASKNGDMFPEEVNTIKKCLYYNSSLIKVRNVYTNEYIA